MYGATGAKSRLIPLFVGTIELDLREKYRAPVFAFASRSKRMLVGLSTNESWELPFAEFCVKVASIPVSRGADLTGSEHMGGANFLEHVMQDLCFAFRMLRRSPVDDWGKFLC